ncbi:MAG TPA: SGNH/GDSL hydrolase family protein [Gemmatimonadales bacterium]|jgi:hypothetical protein|nr:SGNH/GDSL hydrolase family protein [Gemmatimonadales bacterium]
MVLERFAQGVVVRLRLGRLTGLILLTVSLTTYTSDQHRVVLGRWSYPMLGAILLAGFCCAVVAWSSWRTARRPDADGGGNAASRVLVELAWLTWGVAYSLTALHDRVSAVRILNLNFIGSVTPVAIGLEWMVLAELWLAGAFALTKVRGKWLNPGLSIAAVTLALVLGEGLARAKACFAAETQGYPTYSTALWGRRHVRLNREGFRDGEHSVARQPGTRRLLVVGDSYAFGAGINRVEDRFGDQLGVGLAQATPQRWEVINASHPDLHTLQEIAILDSVLRFHPDVVILLYVFNDIDYLHPVADGRGPVEAPRTVIQRLHPVRILFKNSYLFQEMYIRLRLLLRAARYEADVGKTGRDPYADTTLVRGHLADLARFVAKGRDVGAVVGIVPFDHTVVSSSSVRQRHESFVERALAQGLPVWRVDSAFSGLSLSRLVVNRLDAHPNELANRLAAGRVLGRVVDALRQREREK